LYSLPQQWLLLQEYHFPAAAAAAATVVVVVVAAVAAVAAVAVAVALVLQSSSLVPIIWPPVEQFTCHLVKFVGKRILIDE
jgi:steroid 5-alpha reductase family enzyme